MSRPVSYLLFVFFFVPFSLCAQTDSTGPVFYFNDHLQAVTIDFATCYGFRTRISKNRYRAVIYSMKKIKVAQVEFRNEKMSNRNGLAVGYHANDDTQFVGIFRNDKMHGKWVSRYPGGIVCDSGFFIRGSPDGWWNSYYENGQPWMVALFSARKLRQLTRNFYKSWNSGLRGL